jgi:hypothetical protein
MLRMIVLAGVCLSLWGCASGIWAGGCPDVTLSVNGESEITAPPGTPLTYVWSSLNADTASSTVEVAPVSPDACGIANGPWVVDTLDGSTEPVALAACQSGSTYTLTVTVVHMATGEDASASVTVSVP